MEASGGPERSYPTICMGELGCFPITEDFIHPFYRPINFTPWPRDKVKTKFLLFTKSNPHDAYMLLAWNKKNLDLSPFNPKDPVKVISPGWLDSRTTASWFRRLKDTFISYGNYNVIVVEWDNVIPYLMATMNTRVVGAEIANMINFLIETDPHVQGEQFHLIGHSLGAHVCGYAGKRVKNLGRITALDAARPFFQGMPATVRLDRSDAIFVDAIHSDTNPILPVGFKDPIGHVDFYPNGASPQPGCFIRDRLFRGLEDGLRDGRISTIFLQMIRYNTLCSHQLSHKWFEKSIMNSYDGRCQFVGVKCPDYKAFVNGACTCDAGPDACAPMGLDAELLFYNGLSGKSAGEKWFLRASGREPFCQYQYQIVVQLESGHQAQSGSLRLALGYYDQMKQTHDYVHINVVPPDSQLLPGLRLPYLLNSNDDLGDIQSIFLSWEPIPDETSRSLSTDPHHKVAFNSYPVKPVLHLKYIRVTPVRINFGHNRGAQLTRFHCKPHEFIESGIKPFHTIRVDAALHC